MSLQKEEISIDLKFRMCLVMRGDREGEGIEMTERIAEWSDRWGLV